MKMAWKQRLPEQKWLGHKAFELQGQEDTFRKPGSAAENNFAFNNNLEHVSHVCMPPITFNLKVSSFGASIRACKVRL